MLVLIWLDPGLGRVGAQCGVLVRDPAGFFGSLAEAFGGPEVFLYPQSRSPRDRMKLRIRHSGSKAQDKGDSRTGALCRMFVLMWSVKLVQRAVAKGWPAQQGQNRP